VTVLLPAIRDPRSAIRVLPSVASTLAANRGRDDDVRCVISAISRKYRSRPARESSGISFTVSRELLAGNSLQFAKPRALTWRLRR